MALERPAHQLYPSPLRYPGGKGKVANFFKLLFLENDLVGSEYVEPYAGGASVALSLLFEEYASHIHINDLDRSVYVFWKVVLERPDELCQRIDSVRPGVREWERQRRVQQDTDADELDLAFSTFFLNRTNRSGIIGGGIIGGRDQRGKWKIDARWRPGDSIARIEKIARFASRITLTGMDTAEYLESVLPTLDSAFLYLDPPYYGKGKGLYRSFYEHNDHQRIAALVKQLQCPWVVSYDAEPKIEALYVDLTKLDYDLRYTARESADGSEVMFFSSGLHVPEVAPPPAITWKLLNEARAAA
ncbi:MAG TPA: DNA adenine methylase [Solirubrobacterales bacterium]|nr:DNA adenine methylase [Solirubrobacterales bacterium]